MIWRGGMDARSAGVDDLAWGEWTSAYGRCDNLARGVSALKGR